MLQLLALALGGARQALGLGVRPLKIELRLQGLALCPRNALLLLLAGGASGRASYSSA